jgi:ArsR family transcriptional regulator
MNIGGFLGLDRTIFEMHADVCKIFTSPKRLEIIEALREGEKTVSELAALLGIRQANLSQHLTVLREKKVVLARKEGQSTFYRLANPKILKAFDLMREVLLEQLATSERLVKELQAAEHKQLT